VSEKEPEIYCATYCNFGHRMKDGKPVGHECITIPPEALRADRAGDFARANMLMDEARHAGRLPFPNSGPYKPIKR
jgi:hypothetical protein